MISSKIKSLLLKKSQAFAAHFFASGVVFLLTGFVVLGLWYPAPFYELSGGIDIFLLIGVIDLILGPLLTLVVFNPTKSLKEKISDFAFIGFVQIGALLYGLSIAIQARPIYIVFEYDRFRVIHAVDVSKEALIRAPIKWQKFSLNGPKYLSLRPLTGTETFEMTMAALDGAVLSARPELWQSYEEGSDAIRSQAKPAIELLERFPERYDEISHAIQATGQLRENLVYLPVASRGDQFWTLLLHRESVRPLKYLHLDSF